MVPYNDYDKALFFTYSCNWDELMMLMVQTKDELFSKRIEHFLHAFKYERDLSVVNDKLQLLFQYIDHAQQTDYSFDTELPDQLM
jgi:YhdB-like protein